MNNYKIFALTAGISLLLDQASKIYIDTTFELYQSLTVLENFFHITYLRNPGAAFGILSDSAIRVPFLSASHCWRRLASSGTCAKSPRVITGSTLPWG